MLSYVLSTRVINIVLAAQRYKHIRRRLRDGLLIAGEGTTERLIIKTEIWSNCPRLDGKHDDQPLFLTANLHAGLSIVEMASITYVAAPHKAPRESKTALYSGEEARILRDPKCLQYRIDIG